MKPNPKLLRLTGLGGLIGALAFATGDVLLHGLDAGLDDFPAVAAYGELVDDMAKMLALSEGRLFAGSLGVLFLAPLYLAGVAHLYLALKSAGRRSALALALLFTWLYALAPLVHGMFYGLGQALFALNEVAASAQPRLAELYERQAQALLVVYAPVLLAALVGWIWVAVKIARGRTLYPRFMAVLNPVPLLLVFFYLLGSLIPGDVGLAVKAASTNLGAVVFFAASTWVLGRGSSVDPA